jgi:hypothetical protein
MRAWFGLVLLTDLGEDGDPVVVVVPLQGAVHLLAPYLEVGVLSRVWLLLGFFNYFMDVLTGFWFYILVILDVSASQIFNVWLTFLLFRNAIPLNPEEFI